MTGIRIPPELKDRLQNIASLNGRSLNSEITHRLNASFGAPEQAEYKVRDLKNPDYLPALSDADRQILAVFRRLPVEKQLALLSLFK